MQVILSQELNQSGNIVAAAAMWIRKALENKRLVKVLRTLLVILGSFISVIFIFVFVVLPYSWLTGGNIAAKD